jgi:pyruvate dehydrogenase E2 component (dihydrolipoyllysine-residue acetyltransferase)
MIAIKIPKLGLTMERAVVTGWRFKSGDRVRKDDVLLIIETEKVSFELPSPTDGLIHPVTPKGEICEVEQTIGYLAESPEEYEKIIQDHPAAAAGRQDRTGRTVKETASKSDRGIPAPAVSERGRVKSSPLARSMAHTHGLDLALIRGTGPGGRVVRADILEVLETGSTQRPSEMERGESILKELEVSIPVSGVRRVIFDNMYHSLSQSAQLTLHTDAGAEAMIHLRETLGDNETSVSYNAILMKITAVSLRRHPGINVSVENDTIKVWKQVHIGIAMETGGALVVPVIRNPDLKPIRQIDQEIRDLIKKARQKRLSPDDLANGTFTISNLGFEDVDFFTPIIRPPESAILGVGRIVRRPVVMDEAIVPENRISLSLTFDHRIIDGAPAARFLKNIKDRIENPLMLIC